jgi:hypothetical protein
VPSIPRLGLGPPTYRFAFGSTGVANIGNIAQKDQFAEFMMRSGEEAPVGEARYLAAPECRSALRHFFKSDVAN